MVMLMPKREAKTDRRSIRFVPIEREELKPAVKSLSNAVGVLMAVCQEMDEHDIDTVKLDGKGAFFDAIALIREAAKLFHGQVEAAKMQF